MSSSMYGLYKDVYASAGGGDTNSNAPISLREVASPPQHARENISRYTPTTSTAANRMDTTAVTSGRGRDADDSLYNTKTMLQQHSAALDLWLGIAVSPNVGMSTVKGGIGLRQGGDLGAHNDDGRQRFGGLADGMGVHDGAAAAGLDGSGLRPTFSERLRSASQEATEAANSGAAAVRESSASLPRYIEPDFYRNTSADNGMRVLFGGGGRRTDGEGDTARGRGHDIVRDPRAEFGGGGGARRRSDRDLVVYEAGDQSQPTELFERRASTGGDDSHHQQGEGEPKELLKNRTANSINSNRTLRGFGHEEKDQPFSGREDQTRSLGLRDTANGAGTNAMIERRAAVSNSSGGVQEVKRRVRGVGSQGIRGAAERGDGPTNAGMQRKSSSSDFKSKWREAVDGRVGERGHQSTSHPPPSASLPLSSSSTHAGGGGGPDAYNGVGGGFDARVQSYSGITGQGGDDSGTRSNLPESVRADLDQYVFNHRHNNNDDYNYGSQPAGQHYYGGGDGRVGYTSSNVTVSAASESGGLGVGIGSDVERGGEWGPQAEGYTQRYPQQHYPYEHYENQNEGLLISQQQRLQLGDNSSNLLPPLRPPLAPSSTPQRGGGGETMGSGARRGGAWGATMAAGASVERDTFPTSSSQQHLRWDEEEAHSGNQPYQQDAHQKGTSNYGRSNDQTISQPFRYQQHHHEHHHAGATGQAVPPVAGDTYADWASVLDMGSGGGGGTAYNNATAATPPAPSPPTTTAAYGYYPSEEQDHGSHRHNHYQHDDDYRHHFENGEEGQGQHQGGAGVGVGVVGSGLHHPQSAPRFGGMAATEDLIDRALQPSLARPTASNIKTNTNASATVTPKHGVANVVSNTPVAMLMPTPTPTPLPPLQHQDTMMRPATNSIPSGIFGHDNSSPVDRTPSMMSTVVQGNGGATLLRGTLASPQQHCQRRFILHQPQPSRPTIDGGGPVQDGATETNIRRRSTSRSGLRRDVDSDDPRQQHHHDAIDRDDIAEATRDMSPQQNVSDALADDHRSLVHRDGSNIDSTAIVGMGEEALYSLRDGDGDGDGGGGGHQHLVYSEGNAEAEAERYISEDHHRDPHAHYAHPQVSYAAHHAARHDDSHTQDHHYHYHDPPEQMNPLYYESMRGGSGESHDFDRHFKPQHQLIVDEEPPLSPYFGVTGGSVTGGEGFDDNRYPQYTVSVRHDEIAYQGRREYKERAYPPHLLHHHENNGNERHQEYQQHYLTLSSPHDAYHPMMMETSGREAWADQYARDEDHTTNRGALAGAPSHRSLLAYPPQQQQHSSPPPDIPHVVATYAGGMDPLPPPRRGGLGVGGVVSIGTPAPHPSLLQRQQGQRHDTITDSSSHHHYHHIAENESIGNNNGSLRAVDSFAAQVNAAMSKMTRNDAAAAAKIDRNTNGHPFDTKKKHSGNAAAVADTSVFEPSEKNSTNDGTSDRKEGKETVVTGGSQRISRTHSRYSVMAQTPSSGAVVLQNGNNKNRGYDGKTTSTNDTNNTQGHAHDHNSIDLHNSAVRSYLPTPTFYDVKEMLAKEEAEAAARKQAEEKAHALEERKEQEARAQAAREAAERDKAAKAQFEHDQEERRAQAQQDMERRVAALEKEAEDTKAKARQLELALLLKEREIQKSITHVQQSPPTPSNVGRQPSTASRTAEATFAATTLAEPKKEKTDKIISSIHEEVERTTTGTGIRPAVVASRTASQHSQPPRPASAAERCSSIVGNYSPQAPSALASVLVDRTQHQRAVSTQVTPVPSSSNARPFLSLNARNTADSYYHRAATVVSVAEVQTDPLQGRHLVSTGVSARTPTPTNSSEAIVLVSHSSSPTSAPTGPDEDAASTRRHPMPQEADGTHPELAASSSTATLPFSSPLLQSPKSTRGATASSVFDSSSPVPTNMTNNKSVMPDAEEKQHHLQSSGHSKPIDSRSERNHQGVGKMESRGKAEGEGPFPSTVGVDYSGSAVQRLYSYADATPATHSIQGVDSRQESRNSATTPTAGSSARDTIRALEEKLDRLVREQEGLRRANQEARRLFFSDHTYDTYATGAMHNREENSNAFFLSSSPVPHMPSATVSERTASLRALVDKTPVQKHAAAAHYAYRSHNSTVAAASTPTRRADGSIAVVGDGMDESKHVMQRAQLDAMMAEKAALLESLKEENRGLRTRAREARGMSKPSV